MKRWIAKNPVGAMLYADEKFNAIDNGNVHSCTNNSPSDSELNHAVTVIGYTSSSDWTIQNSYGIAFG